MDLREVIDRFARIVLPVLPAPRAARRLLDEARERLVVYTPTFTHGDLGPAHLLCETTGLTGVIDWSEVAIADPAIDAAWMLNGCGGRIRSALVACWDPEAALAQRADLIHQLGPWWEVLYGLEQGLTELVDSGIRGAIVWLPP
ncbi:MAG: phosphotransferase [Egibacteraceae bacterium]